MNNILITGATGNIGFELIEQLIGIKTSNNYFAGVRNIEKAKTMFKSNQTLHYIHFDFENPDTFDKALQNIDRIFILRPPHISDVEKYFKPLILALIKNKVNEVVFLSVQGAEKSKVIPHNKIERLINEYGLDFIFIRPSYFMQNLTTTLLNDIKTKREIILPAGNAKFNWIDIRNIGEVAIVLLEKFNEYKNQAFEITGSENENFEKVCSLINAEISSPIKYRNINPIRFYRLKKQEGIVPGMIIVMILLHFLPRLQKEPSISDTYEQLTNKKPIDLKTFIKREKAQFEPYN